MSQQPSRAETLFKAAAEMASAAERAAFLERECAGDAAMREAVEVLLRERDRAGGNFHDAPTVIASLDATMPMPQAGNAEGKILAHPLHGGKVAGRAASSGAKNAPVKAPASDEPAELQRHLPQYRVRELIGRGGMGNVMKVDDPKLTRTVALKTMKLGPDATDEQRGRFVREASVLAKLAHPNIVPIYDLGADDSGSPFYTMKLVKGRTLQAILKDIRAGVADAAKQHSLGRLLGVFRKVCDAMAFAHSRGVIHRDLKPENIMVGEFGEVLVMDWGLAKFLNGEERAWTGAAFSPAIVQRSGASIGPSTMGATLDGSLMGTPQYMSPEQAEGKAAELDERSDIFSLGAILYAVLTLHPPVEGEPVAEVLGKISRGEIASPSTFGAKTESKGAPSTKGEVLDARVFRPLPHCPGGRVPVALSAVTMKALSVDKARRYQSANEFGAEVEAYQNGFATRAEQASLMKQILLLIQRHKGVFTTAFIAWLVITALAVWFVISIKASENKAARNAELAAKNAQEAKTEATRAVAAEKLAKENAEATRHALAKSQIALAESAYRDHDGAAMQAALKEVPDDLRDSNWSYLLEHADNSIATMRLDVIDLAAHPKKPGVFAALRGDGAVSLVEVATNVKLIEFKVVLQNAKVGSYRFAMSPDGERLAIGSLETRGIVIHSTVDGSKLAEWDSAQSGRMQFSPDGKQLLQACRSANEVRLLDASTGANIWTSKTEGAVQQNRAVFSPDGQKVVTFSNKDRLRLLSAKDGSVVRSYYAASGGESGIAVRPNKPQILSATQDGVVRCIQNTDDGRLIYQFHAEDTALADIAYTADGSRIVTLANLAGGQQSIKVWDAEKGSLLQTLMGGSGAGRRIGVHPLSNEIVVIGQNSKVWSLPAAQEKWAFPLPSNTGGGSFWGTDDLILTLVGKGNVGAGLVDLRKPDPRNQPVWEPPHMNGSGNFSSMTVSADGRFAAIGMPFSRDEQKKPVQLLRLNGDTVEVVKAFSTKTLVNSMQLSPDGSVLRISGKLFDPATGKELVELKDEDTARINATAWVDKTRMVIAVSASTARGREGSVERLILWDATTGNRLQSVDNPTAILCLAAQPGAGLFAEAGTDRIARLRDANTLEVKREFRAHDGHITAMEFHPTRPILATASDDLTVKLWDLDTGRCLEELRGPVGSTRRLSISPGGKRLACWADKVTRIWEPKCFTDKAEATVDADGWENLQAHLKPAAVAETVAASGNGWQMRSGVLFSSSNSKAAVPLPGSFGQGSYQVRVKVRSLSPDHTLILLLPVAGQQAEFVFQGLLLEDASKRRTGVMLNNKGKAMIDPSGVFGQMLKDSEQHELEITVHVEGDNTRIVTRLDETPIYQWSGPVSALIVREDWGAVPKDAIALGTHKKDWVVYAVKAKRL